MLAAQDFDKPFKVDASEVGAGAVFLQDVHGVDHPLCQKHYSTIEKEALALILALKHFLGIRDIS